MEDNQPTTNKPSYEIEFEYSEQLGEFAAALAKAQLAIKQPYKGHTAKIASAKGSYEYKYSALPDVLESCVPHLAANGIALIQAPYTGRDYVSVTTMLVHTSGQWIKAKLTMGIADTRPQTVGSAITYARRYSVGPLVGVAPEDDDDGASAQGLQAEPEHGQRQEKKTTTAAKPTYTPPKSTATPGTFTGTSEQKTMIAERLTRNGVPDQDWEDIYKRMLGKPSTYINTIITEYA